MAGVLDFQAYLQSNPAFAKAWNGVSTQLASEGVSSATAEGQSKLSDAQTMFVNSFEGLTSNIASSVGYTPDQIAGAAATLTTCGHTVRGAVDMVQGLIAAGGAADPGPALSAFSGTLISVAITSGVLSAGVGAAIVGAIAIGVSAMEQLGLFGSPPAGQQVCPNLWINPPPTLQVGCVGAALPPNQVQIQPGSLIWRRFPERGGPNAGDNDWYTKGAVTWSGSPVGTLYSWVGYPSNRLIDSAFPQWHYMMCASVPAAMQPFWQAYLSAWKANQEFALNGFKPQSDAQVLVQLARFWNKAHSGNNFYDIGWQPMQYITTPTLAEIAAGAKCPAGLPFYLSTLMQDVYASTSKEAANVLVGRNLRINTGPLNTPKRTIVLKLPSLIKKQAAATTAAMSGGSAGKTILYVAGGSAAAAAVYGYFVKKDAEYLFKRAWDAITKR